MRNFRLLLMINKTYFVFNQELIDFPRNEGDRTKPHFILGFPTGHSGSTSIDRGLRNADCGWNVVGEFELVDPSEKTGIENNVSGVSLAQKSSQNDFDCSFTDEIVLPLIKARGRGTKNYTYVDMGHFHNGFRTLECLANRLGKQVTFVRIRRNRYSIANSFATEFDTPCVTSPRSINLSMPQVAVCPRSDEGIGAVNLPVEDDIWDSMTPFQRFLWYADEIEHRWHTMTSKYNKGPSYYEINWSDPKDLQIAFDEVVFNKLGCTNSTKLINSKEHVAHSKMSWNCSDFILQDMKYRHLMKYDAQTSGVLVSSKRPQYVDMADCMESRLDLERVIKKASSLYLNQSESSKRLFEGWVLPVKDTDSEKRDCKQKLMTAILDSDPGNVNSFRRRLAMEDSTCYEQSFSSLARHFINRLNTVKPHLHLHIPKTGGTSLCSLARLHKNTTNATLYNCWQPGIFYPVWCCYAFKERKGLLDYDNATCDVFLENNPLPEFVMNENYLDYPLCSTHRIYSVALRDPIDRAMSHERHLDHFRSKFPNKTHFLVRVFNERVELGHNNYMTWALSSGANKAGSRLSLVPQREHLEIAKETLLHLDFLLEFSHNETCDDVILNLMGFNTSAFGRENEKHHRTYTEGNLKPYDYHQERNALDLELYRHAQLLMDIDCEFFARLHQLDTIDERISL
jgi:hypothetical protein